MAAFVGRRLLYLLPVLFAVTLLTFLIASLLPGDLATTILGDQATPETLAAVRHDLGLDQPIPLRFLHWLGQVLQGDLGAHWLSLVRAVGGSTQDLDLVYHGVE